MTGETQITNEHAHSWEAVIIDGELYGKTDEIDGHFHDVSIPVEKCFAGGVLIETSEVDGHTHEVMIPEELLGKMKLPSRDDEGEEETFQKQPGMTDDEEDVHGPDGSDEEEDEKKRLKQRIEEDGLPAKKFQGRYTDKKWDGSAGRFEIDELRRAVPAAMRSWGDAQSKGGDRKKSDYKLPYKEPDGTINVNGVRNALARANQVKDVPEATINRAVAELQRVLAQAKKEGFAHHDEEEKKFEESFTPPSGVASAAKRGLELRKKFKRGGTEVGVARAVQLSNQKPVSADTIKRMRSYFARHEVDKKGKDWNNAERPSNGKIAWLLWGGDAGQRWVNQKKFLNMAEMREEFSIDNDPNAEIVGDKVFIRHQRLFQVGTWNGTEITLDTMQEMARNFNELKGSFLPPIKAGHKDSDHRRQFGEMALGWVHNARVEPPFMVGDLEFNRPTFDRYIDSGSLRFKSIEMHPNFSRNGKEYGNVLTGLALLGVSTPALNDLGPITMPFSLKEDEILYFDFDDDGGEEMEDTERKEFQDQITSLSDKMEAQKKEFEDKLKAIEEEKKSFADQAAASAEKAKLLVAKLRAKDAQAFADSLKAEGILLPVQEQELKSLYLSLDDGTTIMTFSEKVKDEESGEEKEVERKVSQLSVFKSLMQKMGKQVDLDAEAKDESAPEKDAPDTNSETKPIDKSALASLPKSIRQYADEMGLAPGDVDIMDRAKELMADNEKLSQDKALAMAFAEKNRD